MKCPHCENDIGVPVPTKEQWHAYILVAYQDMTYKEAAERLKTTPDSIRMRLYRLSKRFPTLSYNYPRS